MSGAPLPDEEELEERARRHFETWGVLDRLAHIEVRYNPRLRSTLGRARLRQLQIQLNPHLLEIGTDALIDEVLGHEAAHLAAWILFGEQIRPHGTEWQGLMERAGLPIRVRHDLDVGQLQRGRRFFLHLCRACGARQIRKSRRELGACGCGAWDWQLFQAPQTDQGRRQLLAHQPGLG